MLNIAELMRGRMRSNTTVSLILVYVAICLAFAFLSPFFMTVKNFLNIGMFTSIIGIMAAGVTVAMLLGAIDISQWAVAAVTGLMAASMLNHGQSLLAVFAVCLAIGLLCGSINGLLVAVCRIPAIIATIGTMSIFRGIGYLAVNGLTVMIDNKPFETIGTGRVLGVVPVAMLIVVVVLLVIWYILNYTAFGRKVYAVGGNVNASYLAGINVRAVTFGSMVICSVCAAFAGLMVASQVGAAIPSTGEGSEMDVLAAVILGGISLSGGKGRISGTVIGILILATIQNGLTMLSVPSFFQMIIRGTVLILAVLMDVVRSGALKKQ
jgi:ribose transport system permease protein